MRKPLLETTLNRSQTSHRPHQPKLDLVSSYLTTDTGDSYDNALA